MVDLSGLTATLCAMHSLSSKVLTRLFKNPLRSAATCWLVLALIVAFISILVNAHINAFVQLEKGKSYFVAVSPAKYDYPDFAYSIVVLFEQTSANQWTPIGHQLIAPEWDTQAVAVIDNMLLLVNHRSEFAPAVLGFSINQFFKKRSTGIFSGKPEFTIEDIERPTSITVHDRRVSVTFMGSNNNSHGINIYDADQLLAGVRSPVTRILYDEIGMTGYSPSDTQFYKNYLIVSNHYKASISVFDLDQNPPTQHEFSGESNHLYYPLGLAVAGDQLYVGDHIHYFINVFDMKEIPNFRYLNAFGGKKSSLQMPYHMEVFQDKLYVTNMLAPQSISAYSLSSKGSLSADIIIKKNKETLLNAPSDISFFTY